MNEVILKANSISKSFGKVAILKDISLAVKKGESLAITGPSGAGKTTLLNCLSSLENPTGGSIEYGSTPIHQLKGRALAKFRNDKIGFVFQFHHLIPELNALENILLPTWIQGKDKNREEAKALALMEELGIADKAKSKPAELSGGEKQRVAVARSLINDPAILFADEPSGNLDSKNSENLQKVLFNLVKERNLTLVLVTHDIHWADKCDRNLAIEDGCLLSN